MGCVITVPFNFNWRNNGIRIRAEATESHNARGAQYSGCTKDSGNRFNGSQCEVFQFPATVNVTFQSTTLSVTSNCNGGECSSGGSFFTVYKHLGQRRGGDKLEFNLGTCNAVDGFCQFTIPYEPRMGDTVRIVPSTFNMSWEGCTRVNRNNHCYVNPDFNTSITANFF